MFQDVFYTMLLTCLGVIVVGGVILSRRFLAVVSLRGQIEAEKSKHQLQTIKFQKGLDGHQQQLQMLALTKGKDPEEKPEVVKVKQNDIHVPQEKFDYLHLKEKYGAEDAEITELPTTA